MHNTLAASTLLSFRLSFLLALFSTASAETPGMAATSHARFTVITPNLIRVEYAPDGKFVDAPSWFAVNREARDSDAKIQVQDGKVDIDTGIIHLTYTENGKPFAAGNLSAEIKKGDQSVPWHPGMLSTGNLGGTLRTVDTLDGVVPLGEGVLSRDGWYLLNDSQSDLFVGDWVQSRPGKANLDWYLFGYGLDYKAALSSLTTAGGPIPLPRKYVLGIWYSRYWSYTADQFKSIVQEYSDHDFPLDMLVMDMGWHLNKKPANVQANVTTWTGYTWDKALIADPTELLQWMHQRGLHVTLNDHPSAGIQPHEEMYPDFMRAMGKDPASNETIPFDGGDKHYLDTFYQFSHAPREKEGVDFWWLDWQQYVNTVSIPDLTNLQVLNYYNYMRSSEGGLRGQSFSRWAGWGDHRYPIEFSGDASTSWSMLSFEVPFTSTAGNVGAFFWSHDIGGHNRGRNEESYTRWCQFGALTAALRSHSTQQADMDRRPWTYPDWAEKSMRISFQLRSKMMPYLYSSIWQATHDSVPFIRPLYLDHPEVEEAYHQGQEYTFGDNLLVAPIVLPGVGVNRVAWQSVWFPEGDWYDYFTGEKFTGPSHAVAAAPIDAFPLYVRGGVPLPMQPYTPSPGTAPLTHLNLLAYPGQEGKTGTSFVYEDDGVTSGYQKGESADTPLTYVRSGDAVTLTIGPTQGQFKGRPLSRSYTIELPCTAKLTSCSLVGATTTYDEASFTNRIELPATSVRQPISVTIQAREIDPVEMSKRAVAAHLDALVGEPFATWRQKNATVPPELQMALAAVQGVAMLQTNQHPYLLDVKETLTYFHNHHTAPESVMLSVNGGEPKPVTVQPGEPVPLGAAGNPPGPTAQPGSGSILTELVSIPVSLTPSDASLGSLTGNADMVQTFDATQDIALSATATASAGNGNAAIDGHVEGYPNDGNREWGASRQKEGAWLQLTWPQPVESTRISLWDRPNNADQILAGTLEFSDGTKLDVGTLPNDGKFPLTLTFPKKSFTWVKFTATKVSPGTRNAGLSEMAVFKAD
jgi:alpha-glucosidase (family GH31 glycosyl hydrolase)